MLCTAGGAERSYVAQNFAIFLWKFGEIFCSGRTRWVRLVKVQSVRVNFKSFHNLTLWDTFWPFTQKLQLQSSPKYYADINVSSATFLQHFRWDQRCRFNGLGGVALQRCTLLTSKSFASLTVSLIRILQNFRNSLVTYMWNFTFLVK